MVFSAYLARSCHLGFSPYMARSYELDFFYRLARSKRLVALTSGGSLLPHGLLSTLWLARSIWVSRRRWLALAGRLAYDFAARSTVLGFSFLMARSTVLGFSYVLAGAMILSCFKICST
jgi:hypothetical protein